jgi:hypothetical protein
MLRNKDVEPYIRFSGCSSAAAAAYLRHSVMRARLPRLQAVCSGVSPNLFLAFTLILARGLAVVEEEEEDGAWFVPLADRPLPEDFCWSSLTLSQLLAEGGGVPTFDPWSETSTSTLTKFTIRSLPKIKKQRWSRGDLQPRFVTVPCYFILIPLAKIRYFLEGLCSSKHEPYVLVLFFYYVR